MCQQGFGEENRNPEIHLEFLCRFDDATLQRHLENSGTGDLQVFQNDILVHHILSGFGEDLDHRQSGRDGGMSDVQVIQHNLNLVP